jgi:hypothetical protein
MSPCTSDGIGTAPSQRSRFASLATDDGDAGAQYHRVNLVARGFPAVIVFDDEWR